MITSKAKKTKNRNRLCNKQTCICIALIQDKKDLIKFSAVSSKTLKTVKCLPKVFFNKELRLLPYFGILFKRRLKGVTKVFMSEVVLENLKISEPIDT